MRCDDCSHFQPPHRRIPDATGVCRNPESPALLVHRWDFCPLCLVLPSWEDLR